MSPRVLLLLALVTLPLAVLTLLPSPRGAGPARAATGGPVFPTLKDWTASAAGLTVTGPQGTVRLERKSGGKPEEGWALADKGGFPVQEGAMRPLLSALGALAEVEPKTERPALYDRLDLDEPGAPRSEARSLVFTDANGADIAKLIVGKRRYDPLGGGEDAIYIRKPGEARTWLARPAFDVPADALAWIDRKVLDIEAARIKEVILTPAGGKPLTLARDKAEDALAVQDVPKGERLKPGNPGVELAAAFRALDLADVRPLAQVTAAPVATARVVTFDGAEAQLTLVVQDGATWARIEAKGKGAEEIDRRASLWAYALPEGRVKTLETRLADLLEPPPPAAQKR
jgi:hypothetical protein